MSRRYWCNLLITTFLTATSVYSRNVLPWCGSESQSHEIIIKSSQFHSVRNNHSSQQRNGDERRRASVPKQRVVLFVLGYVSTFWARKSHPQTLEPCHLTGGPNPQRLLISARWSLQKMSEEGDAEDLWNCDTLVLQYAKDLSHVAHREKAVQCSRMQCGNT